MRKSPGYFAVIVILILLTGCTKDEKSSTPVLITAEVTGILTTSAVSGGNVLSESGAPVSARGVCWSTLANPEITDSKTTVSGTTGIFTTLMTGLTPNTRYYVRAYATNKNGAGYGDMLSFTTAAK